MQFFSNWSRRTLVAQLRNSFTAHLFNPWKTLQIPEDSIKPSYVSTLKFPMQSLQPDHPNALFISVLLYSHILTSLFITTPKNYCSSHITVHTRLSSGKTSIWLWHQLSSWLSLPGPIKGSSHLFSTEGCGTWILTALLPPLSSSSSSVWLSYLLSFLFFQDQLLWMQMCSGFCSLIR